MEDQNIIFEILDDYYDNKIKILQNIYQTSIVDQNKKMNSIKEYRTEAILRWKMKRSCRFFKKPKDWCERAKFANARKRDKHGRFIKSEIIFIPITEINKRNKRVKIEKLIDF